MLMEIKFWVADLKAFYAGLLGLFGKFMEIPAQKYSVIKKNNKMKMGSFHFRNEYCVFF